MEVVTYLDGKDVVLRAQQNMAEAVVWAWYTDCVDGLLCLFGFMAIIMTIRCMMNGSLHWWKVYKYKSRIAMGDSKRFY
jgi:hypothetical protein